MEYIRQPSSKSLKCAVVLSALAGLLLSCGAALMRHTIANRAMTLPAPVTLPSA
ncbi:hypothetical protein [Edwardsiella piscicida]|uniref:hypothetical protein n=1 Tax=Edwardsiella piscicida TaxID=1263550 RepID=UPI001CF5D032|nr:hypothetical protein [Edwardsiella piscicida]UCQ38949.1 hypothetical protein DCF36_05745 [Edwardsiella piscicida]